MQIDIKSLSPEDILGVECRFATHCYSQAGRQDDLHVVKEVVSLKNGQTFPFVRLVKNYQRPFWVTKKAFQNYTQKKEWQLESELTKHTCTQSQLQSRVRAALGMHNVQGGMRQLGRNPYLYGSDILSTALMKREYQNKNPELITRYTVAASDTETDVLRGTEEIIMQTVSFKERVHTAILKKFLEGHADVEARLRETMMREMGDLYQQRNITWTIDLCDTELGVIESCAKKCHEWKPDFLAFWNIDFDIQKIIKGVERGGGNMADIFSDPKVPDEFRFFNYKQGQKQKVTESGKITPIKPPAQWHTVFCPSSFYFIDGMCAYKHIRIGQQEEASYSLEAILNLNIKRGKLKFKGADGKVGLEWHKLMQSKFPFEYVIYNVFDCIGQELLDEKINDLSLTLPQMSGCSDFQNFRSQPRRVVDDLHFFVQKQNPPRIIGTTSDQMKTELDDLTISNKNWIIMLPAHLVADNGLKVIKEDPTLRTNIRRGTADLDVSASYPNGGATFNISKETTKRELVDIDGVSEHIRRMMGVNLSGGHTNAVEICCNFWGMPTMAEWLSEFDPKSMSYTLPVEPVHEAYNFEDDNEDDSKENKEQPYEYG